MDRELQAQLNTIMENMATKDDIQRLEAKLSKHDEKFAQHDEKFDKIDEKFAQIDERFAQIDERFAQIDERFAKVDEKIDRLERKVDDITGIMLRFENTLVKRLDSLFDGYILSHEKHQELEQRVTSLEHRMDTHEAESA